VRPSQWAALAGVAVLLAGAFALRDPGEAEPATAAPDPRVVELREAVDLEPCPRGLGTEFPQLVLPCLGGGPDVEVRSAAPGRPMLVNVWASWCGPCREEVPALVAFHEKAGERVEVVGVLTQDTPLKGLAFSRDFGIGYPSVVDDEGTVMRLFAPGPPVTLFLEPDGRIAHREIGKFDTLAELEALVAEHLGVRL
jgi:cytochrome c biogenesis protein CcmG/thiol:disulfide interchange protein DsbE